MIKVNGVMGVIRAISPRLATALGDGLSAQVQAGYKNDDLSLTEKGKDFVLATLADSTSVDTALTTAAKADIAAAEAEKESK